MHLMEVRGAEAKNSKVLFRLKEQIYVRSVNLM